MKRVLVAAIALISLNVQASTQKTAVEHSTYPNYEGAAKSLPDTSNLFMTDEQFGKESAAALKRSGRSPASGGNYEQMMSPELKEFRAKLLAVNTAEELDTFIEATETKLENYDQHPEQGATDYKYFAAEFVPVRCLKGIVFKFIPLAEKSKLVQSRLATDVMRVADSMAVFSPTAQWKAGFDYVTHPYNGVVQFQEGYDLQDHLVNSCYKELARSAGRVKALDLSTPIVWDNKIAYGIGTFQSDVDRYKLIGKAEQNFSMASKHQGMSWISFFRAYNISGFFTLQTQLGTLYGFDSLLPRSVREVEGVNLKKRTDKIRSFTNLYKLYDGGERFTQASLKHLKESVHYMRLVYNETNGKPANDENNAGFVVNPAYFRVGPRSVKDNITTWEAMVNGATELHSRITDEKVTVDLPGFYTNPPKDLKSLLPTNFDTSEPSMFHTQVQLAKRTPAGQITQSLQTVEHRNYLYARPTDWNLTAYKSLFPSITRGADVASAARVVAQSWGGNLIELPLNEFVR